MTAKTYRIIGDGFTMLIETDDHGGGSILESTMGDGGDPLDAVDLGAKDAIEALVLAHACAGIDVTDPRYVEGLNVAANAIYL